MGPAILAFLVGCAIGCSRSEPVSQDSVESASSALNALPGIGDFAIYGENSVAIRDRVAISGGDVGVRKIGTGPLLVAGYELSLSSDSQVSTNKSVIANRVLLQDRARVGDVQTNGLTNQFGYYTRTYAFPAVMPTLPGLGVVTPGTTAVTVAIGATRTLSPGSYGAVTVAARGVLRLQAGVFHFASVQLEDNARIDVLAPVQVRVAGRLATLARVRIGAAAGVTLTAGDIRIEISGSNGVGGALADRPQAAAFGTDPVLQAVMLVPNGTLSLGQKSVLTGAFVGRDVFVDLDSRVTYQSGLRAIPCSPPSCDDANPCTADSCAAGTCLHTPVPAGTSCSDTNACNGTEACDGAGHCQAGASVVCVASDQCHAAGTCDPATGACSNPAKPDGSVCSDGDACTRTDFCVAGVCSGTNPIGCADLGANCGMVPNGCGGTLECGVCVAPETCGGGGTPNTCAVPPPAPRAYVVNASEDSLSVIDTASDTVVYTVPVGVLPIALALSPNGKRAYIANHYSNDVSVVDTQAGVVIATVGVMRNPRGIAVSPDGTKVYVTCWEGGKEQPGYISIIAAATNNPEPKLTIEYGARGIAFSPDGTKVLVGGGCEEDCVSVYSYPNNAVIKQIKIPCMTANRVRFLPDNTSAYVSSECGCCGSAMKISTESNLVSWRRDFSGLGDGLTVAPGGGTVYLGTSGHCSLDGAQPRIESFDSATNVQSGVLPTTGHVALAVTPDGSKLYGVSAETNQVVAISTATMTVVNTIGVGRNPQDIVISP